VSQRAEYQLVLIPVYFRDLFECINGCLDSPSQPRHESDLYAYVLAVGSRSKIVYAAGPAPALFRSSQRQVGKQALCVAPSEAYHHIKPLFRLIGLEQALLKRSASRAEETQCLVR
jgi:hypothetical protein